MNKKIKNLAKEHKALGQKMMEIQREIMDELAKLGIDLYVVESYDDNVYYHQFGIGDYTLYDIVEKLNRYLNGDIPEKEIRHILPKKLKKEELEDLIEILREVGTMSLYQ